MNNLDAFEEEAGLFYKDTGFLAPGKSEAAAACGQLDFERDEVRRMMKKAWDAGRRRGVQCQHCNSCGRQMGPSGAHLCQKN